MALEFLNCPPKEKFRKAEQDLKTLYNVDLSRYKAMTPRQLESKVTFLDKKRTKTIREGVYGSWLKDEGYNRDLLLKEALVSLKEHKQECRLKEVLIPRLGYYKNVKRFGPIIEGKVCFFDKNKANDWIPFRQKIAVAKVFEVLRHGDQDDFRKLYFELADGKIDSCVEVSLEHILESSKSSLTEMEKYCDSAWDGPWPWETPAPYKLRDRIEEKRIMRQKSIAEMRGRFNHLLTLLREGEMDKYEVISSAEDMISKVQGMVEDLGKLSGETLLTLRDNARTTFGDEAAEQIQQAVNEPLNQAAESLSRLRASMEETVEQLKSSNGFDDEGSSEPSLDRGMPKGMGSPDMGGLSDELADINLDGDSEERPKKEL